MNISQISRPGPGQTTTIPAAANDKIILGFSTEGMTLARDDSALIFVFDDGAAIRLDDFYTNYQTDNIPEFEIDGRLVSGAEFFSALGPDLIPAEGSAPVERGSHSVAYGDSALQGGVDHLDGLDVSVQGKSAADGALQFDSALTAARGADFGGSPVPPSPSPPPSPQPSPPPLSPFSSGPFVRAVLYSPGNSSDPVTTSVFFGGSGASPAAIAAGDIDFSGSAPGAQYALAVSLPAGWSTSWVNVSFNSSTGRLEFRLTADGVAEMQRLTLEGESLVDFIHVTVTDRASGGAFEYDVEFVATDSQIFDSAVHDGKYGGQHLDNIGEFHQGQNNGGTYNVVSSRQNDEIIMDETVIGGSSIHASGSADPAHMADDFNTVKLNAGVVNTTQGSITHITSADGTLDVTDGVIVQGHGAENVVDMGKGSVHVQNASGDGVSAADGGKNTVSGGEVVVDADDTGLFAKDGGSNTVRAQNGDVSIDGHQWGIVAQDNAANSVAATGGSVNITSGGQALQAQGGSTNSVTTTDGDITINALWDGVAAYDNSTNNLSAANGSVSIKTDTWGISSSVNSSANVDVINGNLEIDAIGRGIHAIEDSTNTVSVTDGDVNINAGWEGLMAHFGGANNIDVAGGSVSINAESTGVFSYMQSASNLTIADGSLTINAGYMGVRAEEDSVNTVAVTDGDISIQAVSGSQRANGLAAASGGSNVLSAEGGTVRVDAHSGPGAAVGMGADANGVNGVAADNRITAGEVAVSSSSDSSWVIGMYAANNNTANQAENSIDTTGAAARGQSGTVSVHANWDAQSGPSGSYEAHALAAYGKNTVNRITADGDVDIRAGSSGNVATGLISRYESDNVIDGQKDIGVSAVSTAHQAAGLRVDTGGHNSLTAKGTVDISATGSTASGMAVGSLSGPGYLVSGSNTITSDEKTTITATAAGSGSGSNAYGMVINYSTGNDGDASNTVTSGGDVAINSSSASAKAYGMAVLSSGTATATAANTITADGRVDVNATGSLASAMYATGAQASNSIATTGGGVTVSAAGTGSGIGNGFGYGMDARDSGSNSILTGSGAVKVSGTAASTSGYGIFANSSGSNTVATTSGNVAVSGVGSSGTGMHATTSGTSNAISTGSGAVNVSGNATNGSGYGMSATISGSNSIITENGAVEVSGHSTSGNAIGMSAVSSGSNTILTEGGHVVVSGSGSSAGTGMSASSGSNAVTTTSGTVTATGNAASSSGHGMYANSPGSTNAINTENGAVEVSGVGTVGYGMYAASSGSNAVSTEGGNVTVSGSATAPSGSSFGYGMYAAAGHNAIATKGGDVTVTGSGKSGYGMHADSSGSNLVTTEGGSITIAGNSPSGGGAAVQASGRESANTIDAGAAGKVSISGGWYGLNASFEGKNVATGGDITITSTGNTNSQAAVFATGDNSSNVVDAGADGKIVINGGWAGLGAALKGSNTVSGGDIAISSSTASPAVFANGKGSMNTVDAGTNGKVVIEAYYEGLSAYSGGSNVVSGGDIAITASRSAALWAAGDASTNRVDAGSDGKVAVTGHLSAQTGGMNTVAGGDISIVPTGANSTGVSAAGENSMNIIAAGSVGKVSIAGNLGLNANTGGKNDVRGGDITITGTGAYNAGVYSHGAKSVNTVDAGATGKVSISGTYGLETFGGKNIVNGGGIVITGTSASASAMFASGGSNTVTSGAGGTVLIDGGRGMMAGGGANTVTGNTVSVVGQDYGLHAEGSGSSSVSTNTVQSASGALSLIITATAASAQKAIAMWADGGGAVNYITGHSQSGGAGDSITLNGRVAMQTANGGRNIITTGAGDDHVTINGAVKGSGNLINVGEGSNTVTLNGAIEAGSLNVIATGGTYTLILQESGVESFADRYGDWLNIVANNLFSGLSSIRFEGWEENALSAAYVADFMATFETILNTLLSEGVSIEPQALSEYLTSPGPASSPAALLAETGAEQHMQDAQHAAVGHDDTQDAPLAAHDGPIFMTGDSPQATFSAQTDSAVGHAGGLEADDIAQPDIAHSEHAVEPAQPLFAFLNAPAEDMSTGMYPADEGDASVHNGYLGSGESGSDTTGLHAAITLTHGDESLDSLFADAAQRIEENGEASLWYVESDTDMHDMALTDMNRILVQNGTGEHAADAPIAAFDASASAGERALAPQGVGSAPSVMDHSQEATDNAVREMANC